MIIASSNVNMASTRSYKKSETTLSTFKSSTIYGANAPITEDAFSKALGAGLLKSDAETIEKETADELAEENADTLKITNDNDSSDSNDTDSNSLELLRNKMNQTSNRIQSRLQTNPINQMKSLRRQMIDYLLKILFGKDYKPEQSFDELTDNSVSESTENAVSPREYMIATNLTSFETYYEFRESEEVSFTTTGLAVTADGREINFGINLTMSRSFVEQTSTQIDYSQPILVDPLVIHLGNGISTLSDQSFYFDLDSDGEEESIKALPTGSGFLAYDKDENGIIDNGSELFGTQSGNGFAELAGYDHDHNNWIDEADDIFSKLKVWYRDENGNNQLVDLKTAGIGAIYLGSSENDYSITNQNNQTEGIVRRHGIFLYENGSVGSIQQIDLATQNEFTA